MADPHDSGQADSLEIEITPAMIEAGELALADTEELCPEQAAIRAFRAMIDVLLSSDQGERLLHQALSG